MKLALIGAGQRGSIYAGYAQEKMNAQIVAIVDPNEEKRKIAAGKYRVDERYLFADFTDFCAEGKIADAVIIASMDRDHYTQTIKSLELGYDILLEKPISPDPQECMAIQKKAHECNRTVTVCHVLRYTNFFATIKKIIDSGELGKVVTIQHAENIGNFHMAHSFVRGNWRNSDMTSPIIMQKSCHDMDILVWLVDSEAKRISSFGSLLFFDEKHAPKNSAARCLECDASGECRFDAVKAYLPVRGGWPAEVVCEDQTEEGLMEALKTSPYGRCVFRCDNNVCDHQVTNIEFKNGVTVSFHLSGMTNRMHRTIKVMCEHGEIIGDDDTNELTITHYSSNAKYEGKTRTICVESQEGFHGGGDYGLTMDFLKQLQDGEGKCLSSIDRSIESHLMAYA
ncbi:MAG: Gfo/Idh/MocA family oxidoreductase, partial [Acetatifactor sp.]|nr:Gfo/Idh/MocA family oxidoreductase [Acetatifactor sp.]